MGIPSYLRHVVTKHREILKKLSSVTMDVDCLYLDCNSDIYDALRDMDTKEKLSDIEFENDPNFETLRLFDIEGNIINVNSWFECANYVNGGWTLNYSNFSGDVFFFGVTSGLLLLYFSLKILVSKKT